VAPGRRRMAPAAQRDPLHAFARDHIAAVDSSGADCTLEEEDTPGPMSTPETQSTVEAENTAEAGDPLEGPADMAEGRQSHEV